MTKRKWISVKWAGLPSIRYFFLTLPNGQRVIVDNWSGFRILHYIPFIRKYQKFDAYFIPDDIDISDWEHLLVSEYDMVWDAAKVSGRIFVLRLVAGGTIGGVILGLFEMLGKPLINMLKFLHIPSFVFIIIFSFLLWWLTNYVSNVNIKKKIPIKRFDFQEKIIKIKFRDLLFSIGINIFVIGIIFFLVILRMDYSDEMIIGLIFLTWMAFFAYSGIIRTADLYITYNEEIENGKGK